MTPLDPIAWEATIRGLRPSSPAWRAVTKAVYGRPLDAEERELFLQLSGGREPDPAGHDRIFCLKGRRGGGSEEVSRWITCEAVNGGHHVALAPGQVGLIAVICPEIKHAKEILGYVKGLAELPEVARHVVRIVDDAVTFKNRIEIRVVVASEMAVGATLVGAVFDEAARLPGEESATPDRALVSMITPGLAPIRGAPPRRMFAITSANIDEGWAHGVDQRDFGHADGEFLVVRGSTEVFNPAIDPAFLERERRKDPLAALREFGRGLEPPQWMPALVENWYGLGVIEGSVDRGRASSDEPQPGWSYTIAIDPAFSRDNFGIAVAARRGDKTIVVHVDALHPPAGGALSPRRCVDHVVSLARDFGCEQVYTDQASAAPLIEFFEDRGIECIQIPWTGGKGETSKPARYRSMREAMRDGLIRLPDDPALIREFSRIRGRWSQQGNETIDAPGRGQDDRVSATVMAVGVAREGEGGSLPAWARPGAVGAMAQQIQDWGGVAFDSNCLGPKGTAPFPGDAPAGTRGLRARQTWTGEWELQGDASTFPAKFTAIVTPGQPIRHGRECRQWGDETFMRWQRLVDAWRAERRL